MDCNEMRRFSASFLGCRQIGLVRSQRWFGEIKLLGWVIQAANRAQVGRLRHQPQKFLSTN